MKHAEDTNAIYAEALKGISFPCSRDDLVKQARTNHADKHVVEVLQNMPDDDTYNTMPDVFVNTHDAKVKVEQLHHR